MIFFIKNADNEMYCSKIKVDKDVMIFMEIRKIRESEMKYALKLVWEVFLEFEAPCYTEEGINEFKRTIDDSSWIRGSFMERLMEKKFVVS